MLLHTCCAPCALPIIDGSTSLTMASTELSRMSNPEQFGPELTAEGHSRRIEHLLTIKRVKDITLYFYNPNIFPEEEYKRRLKDVEKIAKIYKLKLVKGVYEHNKWLDYIKNSLPQPPEFYSENSKRCLSCFRFRLEETAEFAKKNNFKEFSTTLSVNRFKDVNYINQCAKELAKKHQIKYKEFSIDANNAYEIGIRLSKKYSLYRQKYCGCEFSMI